MLNKLAFILLLAACGSAVEPAPSTTDLTVSTPPHSTAKDWRARIAEDLAAMPAALRTSLLQLQPSMTRAQFLRFTDEAVHDPRAASVFLDRLANGNESEGVRAALVDALPRTGGLYADAAVELIATERAASVRAAYAHAARRAPSAQAIAILARGFADAAPEVVAEAIRATATLGDGVKLAAELRSTLGSSDASVRTEAARALGILKIAAAHDELVGRLADPSPDVRLEALRAIERIRPGAARDLPLGQLAQDPDPRISSLVARLTATPASR